MTKEEFTTILKNIKLKYDQEKQKLYKQFVNENRRFDIGDEIKFKKFYGQVLGIEYRKFSEFKYPDIVYKCVLLKKDGTIPKKRQINYIYDRYIKD
jgi:hypothetical protein